MNAPLGPILSNWMDAVLYLVKPGFVDFLSIVRYTFASGVHLIHANYQIRIVLYTYRVGR